MRLTNSLTRSALSAVVLLATALLATACTDYTTFTIRRGSDKFSQDAPTAVDILLVVDNTESMADDQTRVAESFGQFISLPDSVNLDYQIAAVTTTVRDPTFRRDIPCTEEEIAAVPLGGQLVGGTIVTPETPNAAAEFASLLQIGICGHPQPAGLESARLALSEPYLSTSSAGFLRPEASLSVVVVSDSDDDSPAGINDYLNFFLSLKSGDLRDSFNVSSIVISDWMVCEPAGTNVEAQANVADRYMRMTDATDGALGNICVEDLQPMMEELAHAVTRLEDTFTLTSLPNAATIEVTVDDVPWPCEDGGWAYEFVTNAEGEEEGRIVFDLTSTPGAASEIVVTYEQGNGDAAAFCPGAAR
jgi:hypothetical protein